MNGPGLPEEIRTHYESGVDEDQRIREGLGQLELLRTQEVVRRHLGSGARRVLDVGGATGVHAEWLLADGHQVDLVDPVKRHVTAATARLGSSPAFTAAIGDARSLTAHDASYDAVLLFGPLYHMLDRADRLRAWREAARVTVRGGFVFGVGISRFASLFDGLAQGFLFDQRFRAVVEVDLGTGQHRNPSDDPAWFTTAYFHQPDELGDEATEAGLVLREIVGLEGLAAWMPSLVARWGDPEDRETILFSARTIGSEPSLRGLSPHVLAVTQHNSTTKPVGA